MPIHPRQETPSLLQVDSILTHLSGGAAAAEVCRFLRSEFPHFSWLGVYRLEGTTLVLVGWDGDRPTEHTMIPLDRGLCGRAAREGRTVLVGDVSQAPDYLSCFLETRSEIVVPVRDGATVVGEIDVDGSELNAFDASDARFLEKLGVRLAPLLAPPPPPPA